MIQRSPFSELLSSSAVSAAKQTPTPAHNQAASEYARREQKKDSAGWQTVVPASPPMVNYHP